MGHPPASMMQTNTEVPWFPGTGGASVTISLEVFSVLMAEVELVSATPPGSRVLSCEGNDIFFSLQAFCTSPFCISKRTDLLISDFCVKGHVIPIVLLFSMHENSVEVTESLPSNEISI